MQNYNLIQKILIVISIIIFLFFILGLILIILDKEQPNVLGVETDEFTALVYTKHDYESPEIERFSNSEIVKENNEARFKFQSAEMFSANDLEFSVNNSLNISKGFVFIETKEPISIVIHNEVIRIARDSKVFYSADSESLIIYSGFIKYGDQIIEANKQLRFEVDNFYIRDANWDKIQTNEQFNNLREFLIDLDIFEEDLSVMFK